MTRAKFYCQTMETAHREPYELKQYTPDGEKPTAKFVWPRTYRFSAQYDQSVPEDQRYAQASPSGELRIQVDNPAVTFEPGRSYYLDFTEVPSPKLADNES